MLDNESTQLAAQLLYREAWCLDTQDWAAWLDLYSADCEYWVPAWKSEDQLVDDVQREVSLIYHASRVGLEERVLRLRSRKSVTAMPIPRTAHSISNILVRSATPDSIEGSASWLVHAYDPRRCVTHVFFGRCEFTLRRIEQAWKIARKKIVLLNDRIPTVLDFYNL